MALTEPSPAKLCCLLTEWESYPVSGRWLISTQPLFERLLVAHPTIAFT